MRRLILAPFLVSALALVGDRALLVKDFLAHLKNAGVSYTVVKQTNDTLELKVPGDQTQLALENLEAHIAQAMSLGLTAAEAKRSVFDKYASTLKSMAARGTPLQLDTDGKRIRPRLVSPAYIGQFPAILHEPLRNTGLEMAYVLDSKDSVRFLNAEDLQQLGLDTASLHALALANLAPTLSRKEIRRALSGKELVTIKFMDSFDAARLLLVPEALEAGEALAAIVPDRDTLLLAPVPADGNWAPLNKLARVADGAPLLDRALKVTRAGFEGM